MSALTAESTHSAHSHSQSQSQSHSATQSHSASPAPAPAPASASASASAAAASTSTGMSVSHKLWGERFSGSIDSAFNSFNCSIEFDQRFYAVDLYASAAYSRALLKAGLLTADENATMISGLEQVLAEWRSGQFQILAESDEDIHTANERRLGELIGKFIAGKLHTGRSRNDQVATDFRLWIHEELQAIQAILLELVETVVVRAAAESALLMAGFTHLQPAQPIRWAHFLLSYAEAFRRDYRRLMDSTRRLLTLPLGSGALAGNVFNIDRRQIAKELGFADISGNSLDAVSDRDFVAEFLFDLSLVAIHASQLSEDLILFATRGFISIADAYSTGSSLMPQKKNPDALELIRGKSGRVSGALVNILMVLKSLPRAYNKDLQEDKEPVFDAAATIRCAITVLSGVVRTLTPMSDAMRGSLEPSMLATDLAEYLTRKGVPFRDAHRVASRAVAAAEEKEKAKGPFKGKLKIDLSELTLSELQTMHSAIAADVFELWDYEASAEKRDSVGGTSRRAINAAVAEWTEWLDHEKKRLALLPKLSIAGFK